MTILALESLTFGLNRLADAAERRNERLCLLTRDPSLYAYELGRPESRRIDIVEVDTTDIECVKAAIQGVDRPRGLLNLTDTWSLMAVELATSLGFAAQAPESVRMARDKYAMRQRLWETGLSRGPSVVLSLDEAHSPLQLQAIEFPRIIKDCSGTGSIDVWIAHDPQQAEDLLAAARAAGPRNRRVVLEPFFNGPLFSAEAVTWQGRTRVYAVASRIMSPEPHFREEAMAVPVQLPSTAMADINAWIGDVLAALGYTHGISHTEFILTETGPEVVEVNPRAAGGQLTEAVCRAYDDNVLQAHVDMALGQRPALLDAELLMHRGVCAAFVYAPQKGWFERVEGLQRLAHHPGSPQWYPTALRGKRIEHLHDQRASLGLLVAEGETTELAMLHALSAAGKLRGVMRPDAPGRPSESGLAAIP